MLGSVPSQLEALFRTGAFFLFPEAAFAGFRSEPSSERLALRAAENLAHLLGSVPSQLEALFRTGAFFLFPEAAFAGFRSEPSSERLALRAAIKSMI